jgi:Flp pilus assembly protein TadD
MRFKCLQALVLVLFLGVIAPFSFTQAQTQDAAFRAKREEALKLFDQGKRLEALPLLEALWQKDPDDEQVAVALAASLVSHAATLTDQQAAGKERLRARKLLDTSRSTSVLAQNLQQLLHAMPDSGSIQFSENPAVEQAMVAGEAAFSQGDFDRAIAGYSKALELEPKNYTATLFIGNSYHRKNDYAKAREWYEKAIELDPNTETAYRYYAHMLVREGDMAKARTMLIHAAVAEPYNRLVWRDLSAWASLHNATINLAYAATPPYPRKDESPTDKGSLDFLQPSIFPAPKPAPKSLSDAWQAYRAVREEWKKGSKFKEHFPKEGLYRRSLVEENEALIAAIEVMERLRRNIDTAELISENQPVLLLLHLYEAGLVEPYILFRLGGDHEIDRDYPAYRAAHRDKLEAYMDKFVVPPAPTKAESAGGQVKPTTEQTSETMKTKKAQVSK